MKLDTERMVREIDKIVNSDWGFEMVDCRRMPDSKPFTQKEAEEMSDALGEIYRIAHCISCKACQSKYKI